MEAMVSSDSLKEKLRWVGIGLGLKAFAWFLMRTGRRDEWLGKALAQADGVFRFESGDHRLRRHLIFDQGKVQAGREWPGEADFTFTFYHPEALGLGTRPDNVLEVVIGNKVGQSGNLYYIYQFGFILSLVERHYTLKRLRKKNAAVKA